MPDTSGDEDASIDELDDELAGADDMFAVHFPRQPGQSDVDGDGVTDAYGLYEPGGTGAHAPGSDGGGELGDDPVE